MDRSPDMLVGVVGIWKAGGAYVPLDRELPPERLSYIIADTGLRVIVTEEPAARHLPAFDGLTIDLAHDATLIARERDADRPAGSLPGNIAYVIYTSGSTGRPKGVAVAHRGLCNLACWQVEALGVRPGSRILQFAPLSFDASVWELTMALCSGATLLLASASARLPGDTLLDLVEEEGVSHATLPPSALAVSRPRTPSALSTVIAAGEACSAEIVRTWGPGRRFFNGYGPTENTVCATIGECTPEAQKPSIGRPMANVEVYILDSRHDPVPVGVVGELCIGGSGLARGYINSPDLTADRFVPHPFGSDAGARLYRSGDLAQWSDDGRIHFAGRRDHQVKILGYRVELEEIDRALDDCPGVRQSVTVMREDGGIPRLATYVVPEPGDALDQDAIKRFLRRTLPQYMVPSFVVRLDSLPTRVNGKIDRDRLPVPHLRDGVGEAAPVPARSELERVISRAWQDVLAVSPVGIHDNFFDVGGNSLLLVRLHSALQEALERPLPIMDLFKYPTIALFSEHLLGEGRDEQESEGLGRAAIRREAIERRRERGRARVNSHSSSESGTGHGERI
jgi:amino acid adenylation domain-containing protein